MRKNFKRTIAAVMAAALTLSLAGTAAEADAAKKKKIKLASKTVTVNAKKTKTVKIKNVKAKQVKKLTVKSANKKIATAKAKGKTAVKVTGKKAGKSTKVTVTLKLKKQKKATKLTLKVKVAKAKPPVTVTNAPAPATQAPNVPSTKAPDAPAASQPSQGGDASQAPASQKPSDKPKESKAPATQAPEWKPDDKVKEEIGDIELAFDHKFEKAEAVNFDTATSGYPDKDSMKGGVKGGIDVRYYNKVIVTFTCNRALIKGTDMAGKVALNKRDADGYTDGYYLLYLNDLKYENGGYKCEYLIQEKSQHTNGAGDGRLNDGEEFGDVGLVESVSVQLEDVNPYLDSEGGKEPGVDFRLKSIEFKAPEKPVESAKPGDPSARPADPSAKPADPSAKPADPSAKPADPSAKPADPSAKPADPSAKPADPSAKPSDPSATPSTPTEPPEQTPQPGIPFISATLTVSPTSFYSSEEAEAKVDIEKVTVDGAEIETSVAVIAWISQNTSIATVETADVETKATVTGVKKGNTQISVILSAAGQTRTLTKNVTVYDKLTATTAPIQYTATEVAINGTVTPKDLKGTAIITNGNVGTATWKIVDGDGKEQAETETASIDAATGVVTGKKAGTVNVKATVKVTGDNNQTKDVVVKGTVTITNDFSLALTEDVILLQDYSYRGKEGYTKTDNEDGSTTITRVDDQEFCIKLPKSLWESESYTKMKIKYRDADWTENVKFNAHFGTDEHGYTVDTDNGNVKYFTELALKGTGEITLNVTDGAKNEVLQKGNFSTIRIFGEFVTPFESGHKITIESIILSK